MINYREKLLMEIEEDRKNVLVQLREALVAVVQKAM